MFAGAAALPNALRCPDASFSAESEQNGDQALGRYRHARPIYCGDNLDQLRKEGREIKPLTVREILDEEIKADRTSH